jgi:hypothetical protein
VQDKEHRNEHLMPMDQGVCRTQKWASNDNGARGVQDKEHRNEHLMPMEQGVCRTRNIEMSF